MPRLNQRAQAIPANPLSRVLPTLYRHVRQQQPIEWLDPFWRSIFVQPQRPQLQRLQPNTCILSGSKNTVLKDTGNNQVGTLAGWVGARIVANASSSAICCPVANASAKTTGSSAACTVASAASARARTGPAIT